jgi:hypothetical protein
MMQHLLQFVLGVLAWFMPATRGIDPLPLAGMPVAATIDTTLTTASGQIRQFAFDGDPDTYFVSAQNAAGTDHFTLRFDKPVALTSIAATTGQPNGGDALDAGTLEVSADGKTFEPVAKFVNGVARAKMEGRHLLAVRLRPSANLKHPLAIREIALQSEPAVTVFKYPVEFIVDVSDAPEMKAWAEKAAAICERHYAMICDELKSDGFKPPTSIRLTLKNPGQGVPGVAATGGNHITGNVRYFKRNPEDFGAIVHETVHCMQAYRRGGGRNAGWLVEGIADYVRFFKYEPGKLRPLHPDRARYNGSYQVTASFLAFVVDKSDKEAVRKLNTLLREGKYKEESFKDLTGKTVQELEAEWKASLHESLRR